MKHDFVAFIASTHRTRSTRDRISLSHSFSSIGALTLGLARGRVRDLRERTNRTNERVSETWVRTRARGDDDDDGDRIRA